MDNLNDWAYQAEIKRLQNQYKSRQCANCSREIFPGSTIWIAGGATAEIYCSAECFVLSNNGYSMEYDEQGYESNFKKKD